MKLAREVFDLENSQKKAVIIGGSNGIGLAISSKLIDLGYYVEICDRMGPDEDILDSNRYHYNYCDLLELNEELLYNLASDKNVELLMITAGIGRIADFQFYHTAEYNGPLVKTTF